MKNLTMLDIVTLAEQAQDALKSAKAAEEAAYKARCDAEGMLQLVRMIAMKAAGL
jgi:hypothetical protein